MHTNKQVCESGVEEERAVCFGIKRWPLLPSTSTDVSTETYLVLLPPILRYGFGKGKEEKSTSKYRCFGQRISKEIVTFL